MRQLVGMRQLVSSLALLVATTAACSANPPPRWQSGGAPLVVQTARWDRGGSEYLEVKANGQVVDEDGDAVMLVDTVGRVVDEDNEPVAILLPDGKVFGTDSRDFGHVGVSNAAPPGSGTAWFAILPNGQVVAFDEEGERENAGVWHGCQGPMLRTCTLITHVVSVRRYVNRPRSGVGVGIGIGIGY